MLKNLKLAFSIILTNAAVCFLSTNVFFIEVASAQPDKTANSVNKLGLDLYRDISEQAQKETVVSPFSVSSALAMTLAGAQGDTYNELKKALNFDQDDQSIARGIMAISDSLNRAKDIQAEYEQSDNFDWFIANRLFGEQSYNFLPDYLNFVSEFYKAPLEKVNFKSDPESSRLKINKWVQDATKDKIKNLIPERAIDSSTRLALVNALYLRAAWQEPFIKERTQKLPFYVDNDKIINTQMMNQVGYFGYQQFETYQQISVPYKVSDLRFNIILPNKDQSVSGILHDLDLNDFNRFSKAEDIKLNLYLPRFKISTDSISLRSAFKKMSVNKAFDSPEGSADFSKMGTKLPDDYLYLSDIFHKVFFEIDEEGTEAAAATAVIIAKAGSAINPKQPKEVRVDRPFVFFIQHIPSSAILFIGNVIEPQM